MNIDFSGLLKLYKELSGTLFCYIFQTENDSIITASSDSIENNLEAILSSFYGDLSKHNFDIEKVGQTDSCITLKNHFNAKQVFLTPISNFDTTSFYFVDINNNTTNPIDINEHLETIINSIKTELTLNYELHEKLEFALSKIDAVVYSYNVRQKKYDFISNSSHHILGLSQEDIYKNPISMIRKIPSSALETFKIFTNKVKQGETAAFDYEYRNPKGKTIYLHHVAEPITNNGRTEKVVGVISDVTREMDVIRRLEKSEKRFGLLINTAIDFIYSLNGFGYLIQVNENGANALGYSSEEMLGKHFLDFAADYQKAEISKSFQNMLSSKSTIHFEIDLLHKLNKSIKYEFLATPLLEADEITGMLGIGRDVTRRRKSEETVSGLEQKLAEAKRLVEIERDRAKQQITILEEINVLKNEFISNVSHELRTPLASIVGFAETLATDDDLPRELVNEFSGIILTEGKRLARFIDDILDFSQLENGGASLNKEEFNIIDMLKHISLKVEEELKGTDISFTSRIPEAEIIIFADREKLVKAFSTIFENSIRYTNGGDSISIVVQDFLKEVEIVISDSGNGISESELELLFDKFHSSGSTNAVTPTAGIALSLVKQIFDHHKGLLQVKSSIGEGTTFIIRLPKNQV
jgi:PAS domain S-box-containing protein